jgi:hypothetical protein
MQSPSIAQNLFSKDIYQRLERSYVKLCHTFEETLWWIKSGGVGELLGSGKFEEASVLF